MGSISLKEYLKEKLRLKYEFIFQEAERLEKEIRNLQEGENLEVRRKSLKVRLKAIKWVIGKLEENEIYRR